MLDPGDRVAVNRPMSDFRIEWYSGTGNGGQYRNKHQNCCRLIHIPTGLIQTANGRERLANERDAFEAINRRLDREESAKRFEVYNADRRDQMGSGMQGDKRRTYRFQEDSVRDDITGKTAICSKVMRGYFDLLW